MSYLTRAIGAVKLFGKAHGPTIMVTTGVVSMGAGAIVGARKTLYLEDALVDHAHTLEQIELGRQNLHLESYDNKKAQSDRIKVYTRAGFDVCKLYALPGTLFIGGAALVFGGHHLMVKRNATLALAFTALKKVHDAYRQNVRDQWGSEADQAMLGGYSMKEVIDPDTNEVKMVPQRDWDQSAMDPYNRVFGPDSSQFENDLSVNKLFIQNQQKFAQILLGQRGYLYLSEVYESLGFPESDISRVVGWKVTRNPDGTKNIPVVDFGLDKAHHDDFKYSRNNEVYLDFNCQGLIVGGKVQKILEASR